MNDLTYIIIIIILVIFTLIYGGHNSIKKVEYNNSYFKVYDSIKLFEKKIQKFDIKEDLKDNIVDIKDYIDYCDRLLPNLLHIYYIKLLPYEFFNINKINKINNENNLFIIYNHNIINKLELLLKTNNNIGFFYDIKKKFSVTDIYPIYNNSNNIIFFTIFVIKKPYWII